MSGTGSPSSEPADRAGESSAAAPRSPTPNAEVRVLRPGEAPAAVALIARAFDQEAAHVALVPDPEARRVAVELNAHQALRSALRYGTAHGALVDGELGSVTVWIPPGGAKVSASGVVETVRTLLADGGTVAGAVPDIASTLRSDVSGGLAILRERRQAVARASRGMAWELAFIATSPDHQGQGLARSLLDRQLRRCDEDGTAAWLETTDPVNPPIYERFDFDTVAYIDGPAWLPGMWVMRREPRAV